MPLRPSQSLFWSLASIFIVHSMVGLSPTKKNLSMSHFLINEYLQYPIKKKREKRKGNKDFCSSGSEQDADHSSGSLIIDRKNFKASINGQFWQLNISNTKIMWSEERVGKISYRLNRLGWIYKFEEVNNPLWGKSSLGITMIYQQISGLRQEI